MATSKEKSQANRAATITGNSAGSVLEDGASIASGLLIVSDLDKGENQVKAIKEKSGEYGKFSISADGSWTYVLNKNSKDVQELAEGETVTEKFVVTSKDGSASKTVVVTVTGTNDVASIKGDTRATLTEDSRHTTARGELEVKDADHGQSSVQAVASQAGTYGSFSIDNKGHWTYVMDNSRAATQALAQGEKGTDSFVVWSKDGSASQTVTVTLKGVNDEATITGQDTGSVSEDAAPNTATGQLIVNDVDNGENTVVPITAQAGAYGSFSIVADGSWTYTLDNSLLAVQSLPAGVTLTESFVVWSNDSQLFLNEHDDDEDHDDEEHDSDEDHDDEDGDDRDEECHDDDHAPSYKGASKVVTVTIVGTNDAAVITGSSTGALTEDLSLGVTGQLNVVDIDTGESSFQAQSNTVGTFGSLSIGTDGAWSYALNNGADNVQALAAGETATDTFVVKSYDGTEQQITLTLTGTNDLATISGSSTGAVTEDTALATGAALAVADVDHGEAVFQAQAAVAATYGSFDIGVDGNWTYALNNSAANVQALAAGEQVTDSFTVVSKDGTASQLVTVTITGTNDGPVVANSAAAAVGAVAEDGTLSATGQLSASDVDNGATQAWSVLGGANGEYGAIGIDAASGQWTYNLNNDAANVQALAAGQSQTETFSVRVTDDQGATADQQVSVTVTGDNDGPVVSEQDVLGSVLAVAQAGSAPVTKPIEFTVQQYLGHQSNSLADLRGYAASHTANYTVQTNVIDYTDDPAGFSGELPGSSRWPAAQAQNVTGTGGINNVFFARITADFSVDTADTYTFRTFNDDGVFLLIDNTLVISDTGYHPEYPFTGSIALTPGNHTIELFFFENGGEASLEFSARTSTGSYGLVGSSGGGFSGGATQVTDTGLISFSDVDLTDVHLVSAAGTPIGDTLGSLSAVKTSDTTGSGTGGEIKWTYTAPNSALVYLAAGQTKVESFTITLNDQHGGVVTKQIDVTLTGTNDVASISGVAAAQVAEDSTASVGGTLTVADQDQGEAHAQDTASAGTYGDFAVDSNGNWSYALNNTATNVQALAAGQTATETFVVTSLDGTATQDVTIAVTGTNDGPVVTNTTEAAAGAVTEDGTLSVSGQLSASDVDNGATQTWSVQGSANGAYGAIGIDAATGQWTYNLNNAAANVQALASGESHVEAFTVRVTDDQGAFVDQQVNVTVTGSNDGPVVINVAAAAAGAVAEDGALSATGQLSASDVDNGATQSWSVVGADNGMYGAIGIDAASGQWTYNLNNSAANVQALAAGETHTETFTLRVTDDKGATADQSVSVVVTGSNDGPTGSATAVLAAGTEDTAYTVSTASLLAGFSDADNGAVLSIAGLTASNGSVVNNGNGTYTITPTANFNGAVTLNYNVVDGQGGSVAATQSYNLAAVNDAPVLQGTMTEQLYTSSLSVWTPFLVNNGVWVTPTGASSGDTAPHTFVRQFTAAQDGNYVFQFAVDNQGSVLVDGVAIAGLFNNDWSHSTVQTVALTAGLHTVTMNALNWGGPAAFAMNITDPNNHEIWNTRTHLDPEPLILSYTENQAAMVVSAGLTLTDIDSANMTHATVAVGAGFAAGEDVLGFANQNGITGVYDANTGVLSLSGSATQAQYQAALRSVTYSNSSDSPSTADRTINFTVDDGSGQSNLSNTVQSKIVVMAVNDAATISGASSGSVTEDTTLTASGSLTVSDADAGQAQFQVQTNAAGAHGTFNIDANGQWTYTLDNVATEVQALDTGNSLSDSFTVLSLDGTASQVVIVGINGLDDNQKPVAVNDTLQQISGSGVVIGFEAGTFTQSGYYTVVSNGFTFTPQNTTGTYNGIQAYGPNISSGWGYNNSYSLYSNAYSGSATNPSLTTMPIEMVRTDGSVFALDKANITGYNGNQTGTMLETVTGYLNGVQVAQESFTVVNSSTGTRNSLVDLTATGFNAVDRVEFKLTLSNSTSTNPHQWIDNIALGGTMVNLLANDSDPDAGATLSINSYDAVSTLGASVAVSSSGVVTYNASNVASVKALAAGETAVDTFTYDVKDQFGAVSNRANVTYTVTGSNDVATLSGTTTGSVKEDVTASATGRVLVTDADHDQSFAKVVSGTSAYGSYSVDVNGNWSYSLNNNLASVQALSATQTVSDSFTVTSADGSATQQVTMSIAGTNDAPVVANDTISGGLLTFEPGTTTNLGSSVITGDFTFTGTNMYLTSYYGANSSYCLYSYSYGSSTTAPITMKRTDGGVFSIETANITGYNYQTAQYDTETITGYRGGVKVAQQVVSVLDSSFGARNNTVTLTDPGFNSVDQVVFSLAGSSYYYLYQWLDNISVPNSVAKVSNVNVLANDTDKDSGAVLSIGSFSATSAHGAAISLNADGTLHYDPTISAELQAVSKGVSVQDSFTYQAQDQFGVLSNTATVEVTLVGIA